MTTTDARTPEGFVGTRWLRRTGLRGARARLPELTVVGLSLALLDDKARPMLEIKTRGGKRGVRTIAYLAENYREVPMRRADGTLETPGEWYARTGHCWGCGQPGSYCLCPESRPCPCRELHPMGSGLAPDALDAFTDRPAGEDQEALFGGDRDG